MKAYNCQPNQNHFPPQFENGQELIWDSGSGFDVVVYRQKSTLFNGQMSSCEMKTGIKKGHVIPINENQLSAFSLKKWSEMRRKYDLAA